MAGFEIISPIDGRPIAHREYASQVDIETTLVKSENARENWRKTDLQDRKEFCRKAVDYFKSKSQEWGETITRQMGRPIRYTPSEINSGFVERADYMIQVSDEALENISTSEKKGFTRYITKEPLGTVLVLAPWNYPFLTSVNVIIPALLAGNTVILKHSEQTALCAECYQEAFDEAGLPAGVFQHLRISHSQIAETISDRRISYTAFTGSVSGGFAIEKALSEVIQTSGLELGGKDPAYVCADADVQNAVENLVDGSFFNSGQSCCGVERIYVDESVYERFLDGFVELTNQYELGDPLSKETTLGPMVRKQNAELVKTHLMDAKSKGANTLIEIDRFGSLELPYLAPQVLTEVNHEMKIMTEETFGPTVGIMKVKSDQEAVSLMNDSDYALTASIWTSDLEKAQHLGQRVETGTWFMNRCDYLDPELAWTGIKNSGRGITLSKMGFDHLTRPKSFHLKHS